MTMGGGIHEQQAVDLQEAEAKISKALELAFEYAQIDGAHHKTWVIDQMVRALTGDAYEDWVEEYQGEDGEYEWDEGIAP